MNENVCQICELPGHLTRNCPGIPFRPQDRVAEPASPNSSGNEES